MSLKLLREAWLEPKLVLHIIQVLKSGRIGHTTLNVIFGHLDV